MGKYLTIVVIFLVLVIFLNHSSGSAVAQESISQTPTPNAAPWPTMVFYTGDSIDTLQNYAPKKDELCITWNHLIGRIGPYYIPSGKSPLILKFTESQSIQPMVVVWCENAKFHTPEERLSWLIQDQPCCYTWERGAIKYIGANMQEVTLTPTSLVTNTLVPTLTSTEVPTETQTSSPTRTSSPTITATRTSTPTRTNTSTRTRTRTVVRSLTPTPVTRPDFEVNNSVSTLYQPDKGDVCFGEVVGNLNNSIVEFLLDYNFGIEIIGGGCFGKNKFSLSEILRYLESRGIRYSYSSLPRATLTPSRTLVPTATIVSYVHIGIQTDRTKNMILQPGTICWGHKVSNFEYKVVKYHKGTRSPIRITNGGCTLSENLSAEDVYNYLRRRLNLPLNGFVDVR